MRFCWQDSLEQTARAGLMQAEGTAWAKPVVVPSAKGDIYPDSENAPLVPAGDFPQAQVSSRQNVQTMGFVFLTFLIELQ